MLCVCPQRSCPTLNMAGSSNSCAMTMVRGRGSEESSSPKGCPPRPAASAWQHVCMIGLVQRDWLLGVRLSLHTDSLLYVFVLKKRNIKLQLFGEFRDSYPVYWRAGNTRERASSSWKVGGRTVSLVWLCMLQVPAWHTILALQAIQRQLEEVEERQRASEIQGVRLEKALRGEAGRHCCGCIQCRGLRPGTMVWEECWSNHPGKAVRPCHPLQNSQHWPGRSICSCFPLAKSNWSSSLKFPGHQLPCEPWVSGLSSRSAAIFLQFRG